MTLTTKHPWFVRTSIVALGVAGALGWLAGRARAGGIPAANPMRFTGTISEQGVPVNGQRDLTINLYDDAAAGTLLCSTVAPQTAVAQGRFTVPLVDTCTKFIQGDNLSSTVNRPDSWVEVQVGGVSFGRQKVGAVPYAVTAGAVNGVVSSTAILPSSAQDGVLGRGANGASIYNDNVAGSLIITGTGGNHSITLKDNVIAGGNIAAGSFSTAGNLTVTGSGKVLLGVYVNYAGDVTDVGCRQTNGVTDTALGGGVDCHQDYDQMVLRSHPTPVVEGALPTGWYGLCMNHSNSGITSAPQAVYVICAQYGK
jgi:hypothetical protein